MRVVQLTKYDTKAASTRQRFSQYVGYLERENISVETWPLLGNEYLEALYEGRPLGGAYVLRRYIDRISKMRRLGRDADILWVHCDLLPFVPGAFEKILLHSSNHVVFDYDDAIFHQYDMNKIPVVRALLGQKLRGVLSISDAAFCGNKYLMSYAAKWCRSSQIVPTVVDTDAYTPWRSPDAEEGPRIGWIGTPSTWKAYMAPMLPMLTTVATKHGGRIVAVGAGNCATASPRVDYLDWSEEHEVEQIQSMDIGVMPLDDSPWSQGKCGYKLIQYMACGLPVVASPVGVNGEIVEHGVNGFLAQSEAEWREALERLVSDPGLRRRMGAAGRRKVEQQYAIQVWGPRVAQTMLDIAGRQGAAA